MRADRGSRAYGRFAAIHRFDEFGCAVFDDGFGLLICLGIAEAGLLGGDVAGFRSI
jgi:hypothetical protein